jgi:hypothetical protein
MDVLKVLRMEEKKLLLLQQNTTVRLSGLRQAINALSGGTSNGGRTAKSHALKGRKISAAHRAAIKAGWLKRRQKLKLVKKAA